MQYLARVSELVHKEVRGGKKRDLTLIAPAHTSSRDARGKCASTERLIKRGEQTCPNVSKEPRKKGGGGRRKIRGTDPPFLRGASRIR